MFDLNAPLLDKAAWQQATEISKKFLIQAFFHYRGSPQPWSASASQ